MEKKMGDASQERWSLLHGARSESESNGTTTPATTASTASLPPKWPRISYLKSDSSKPSEHSAHPITGAAAVSWNAVAHSIPYEDDLHDDSLHGYIFCPSCERYTVKWHASALRLFPRSPFPTTL